MFLKVNHFDRLSTEKVIKILEVLALPKKKLSPKNLHFLEISRLCSHGHDLNIVLYITRVFLTGD